MTTYKIVIKKFSSGLNELLKAQTSRYDPRTKKVKVWNNEKAKNDKLCRMAIKSQLGKFKIDKPIVVHCKYFMNFKHDADNVAGAFKKSLMDSLQEVKALENDNSKFVYGFTDDYEIDSKHKDTVIWVAIEEVSERPKDNYDWSDF